MNRTPDNYEDEIDRIRIRSKKKRAQKYTAGKTSAKEDNGSIEFADVFDEDYGGSSTVRGADGKKYAHGHISKSGKKTGKGKWRRWLLIALLIAAGVILWSEFRADGWWTVAVFGLDSRDGNLSKGALSDVEMLCSINKKSGEIRLLSVFRDTYVRIDDDDYDKINEAYFLGGPEQALNALETNFDLSIDDYASFNWKSVVDALNILGGVDLEISDSEFAYINSFITETVESTGVGSSQLEHSGLNHLDGVQAVAYARLRLMDTDFQRTERQRKVLGLAMEKIKQADITTLTSLVGTVFPQISTSIGVDDILQLAKNAKKYYISETSGFPFSHEEVYIGKKSCVVATTLQSNVVQLHEFLYSDSDYTPSALVNEISSAISEISGLSEPGKDQESGKNIGAQGNTGEQQTVQSTVSQTEAVQNTEKGESTDRETADDTENDEDKKDSSADESEATDHEAGESGESEIPEPETGSGETAETDTAEGSDSGTGASEPAVPDISPAPGTAGSSDSSAAGFGQERPVPEASSGQSGPSQKENSQSANDPSNSRLQAPGESGLPGSSQTGDVSPGVSP